MNEAVALYALVNELKKRRAFVSMTVTNAGVTVCFWVGNNIGSKSRPEIISCKPDEAWGYVRAMRENERRELDWVGRRYGRTVG